MDNLKDLPKVAKSLKPVEPRLPSKIMDELIKDFYDKNITELAEKHGVDRDKLLELLQSRQGEWEEFLVVAKRTWDLKALETIEKAREAVHEKIEKGWLEAAQKGSTTMAILHDKVFQPQQGPTFNIAGKKVEVKTSFNFKPYRKR